MAYYVILVKVYNDGTDTKKALYEYSTLAEALASFHSQLGGAIGVSTITSVMVKVLNEYGKDVRTGYWAQEETEETEE
ncbi:MAG: hypothetical protein K5900_06020 [Butyrivibrio sp.]|nr:hypothetical protein [Butyrivibrio sp.]